MTRFLPSNCTARVVAALLLLVAICSSAQAVVSPARNLPSHIKRVYIREFKNNSRYFGAQAPLTLHVNDEFMLDGRLDVVQSERSDARIEGQIVAYREYSNTFGSDEFPLVTVMELNCIVELWDPYDPDRLVPLFRFNVPTTIQYVSDSRRSIAETETEAKDRLLRQVARNVVLTVLEGKPIPPRRIDKANTLRYQERRGVQKYEPVITTPRFPKPTPVGGRLLGPAEEE